MATDEEISTGLAVRFEAIERAIVDFNRRSDHRETVIDRLHDENQLLRGGLHRGILEPVLADLIRLHDGLLAQAARLSGDPARESARAMFASFADDVEMTLDRCGMEVFSASPGERFDAALHTAVDVTPCTDPDLHNTVAVQVATGLRERETGRVRRPAKARFHQYQPITGNGNDAAHEE